MPFNLFQINKNQTLLLKMVAITMIVMHNYAKYSLPGNIIIGENEFHFKYSTFLDTIYYISQHPYYTFEYLFSFLGHFGVQIFIFISGYGLSKVFSVKQPNYIIYLSKSYIKLYFLMVFGLCIVVPVTYLLDIYGSRLLLIEQILSFINKFTLQYDYKLFSFSVGAWWYFALTFQLYTIFPILYIIIDKYKFKGFFSILSLYLVIAYSCLYNVVDVGFNIQESILGHLPEVCFAILVAKKNFNIPFYVVIIAIIVFGLSNIFEILFPISFIAALIVILFLFKTFISKYQNNKLFLYIGKISMIIFVSNSALRFLFYNHIPAIPVISAILYLTFLIVFCGIAYWVYNQTFIRLENFIFKFISTLK